MKPGAFHSTRWQFNPPWRVTRWGFIRGHFFARGCDGHHNRSRYVVLPLIGSVVFFWEPTMYDRDEPEHLHAPYNYFTEGRIVRGCVVCAEILVDMALDDDAQYRDDGVFVGPSEWIIRGLRANRHIGGNATTDPGEHEPALDEPRTGVWTPEEAHARRNQFDENGNPYR